MIHAIAAAALLLAQQPGLPQAPAKPCITKAEASDLAIFLMPSLIQGAAQKCRAALPRNSFLSTTSRQLSDRLRREGGNRWGLVKPTIERVTGSRLPALFGEQTTMRMAESTGASAILRQVDVSDCGTIDEALEALAPLPAANLGKMFAIAIEAGAEEDGSQLPFTICPARPV